MQTVSVLLVQAVVAAEPCGQMVQVVQGAVPDALKAEPATQGVGARHCACAVLHELPAVQLQDVWPVAVPVAYCAPAGQVVQADAPTAAVYEFAAHGRQAAPATLEYAPGAQAEHCVSAVALQATVTLRPEAHVEQVVQGMRPEALHAAPMEQGVATRQEPAAASQ